MYDTVKGSDYFADQNAVEILAKEAPDQIANLNTWACPSAETRTAKLSSADSADTQKTTVKPQSNGHVTFPTELAEQ